MISEMIVTPPWSGFGLEGNSIYQDPPSISQEERALLSHHANIGDMSALCELIVTSPALSTRVKARILTDIEQQCIHLTTVGGSVLQKRNLGSMAEGNLHLEAVKEMCER